MQMSDGADGVAMDGGHDQPALSRLGLAGRSEPFRRSMEAITRLARVDVPVLLQGETGTGKELAARAMHALSARRNRPFVPVDCGALPETLFAAELFGHVRGAFTDARHDALGLVAQAEGGMLFFDEIHVLSLNSQAALLRFLQDSHFRPLGSSTRSRPADVRIVAATNCEIAGLAAQGAFREDLLYRLNVASVRMPSLRQRPDDIPELVALCVARFCARYGRAPCRFDEASLVWMQAQPWRGNVRELENFVQRCLLACDGAVAHVDACGAPAAPERPHKCELDTIPLFNVARAQALAAFETSYLRSVLGQNQGNVSAAARQAGKERRVFGRLMKKHGIDRGEYL
jgi:DNA-binding NtrC family response regulator